MECLQETNFLVHKGNSAFPRFVRSKGDILKQVAVGCNGSSLGTLLQGKFRKVDAASKEPQTWCSCQTDWQFLQWYGPAAVKSTHQRLCSQTLGNQEQFTASKMRFRDANDCGRQHKQRLHSCKKKS